MNRSKVSEIILNIEKYRKELYKLVLEKGVSHPDGIQLSQCIDELILEVIITRTNHSNQDYIYEMCS
ncbi:aspartyl-phosphate phosphatase Spo0E family protein [Bacillus sp. MRMR6]|uniref:aspartyl-phosphate phosphatase Spo0E family protein n=1 Tax=Bacillus sp. MRMR6 TaxID=1928617 RepID=UPI00095189A7|nr:aspartyl-phosphate phosphatase Spo0E family protein [Bacillus sp. MRMR6]OLS36751.1 hypothetical protein BTR25_17185 [Bacillus sp. MRMR6]